MDGRHAVGGSLALAGLIDKHGEALVPDLKHYFGVDLWDLFAESPLSPRYVLSLVKWLGSQPHSLFFAEQRGGPQFRGWDADRYMAARQIDLAATENYLFRLAHRDPKKPLPKPPEPYPLPDTFEARKQYKPGSFGFITKSLLAETRRRKAELA